MLIVLVQTSENVFLQKSDLKLMGCISQGQDGLPQVAYRLTLDDAHLPKTVLRLILSHVHPNENPVFARSYGCSRLDRIACFAIIPSRGEQYRSLRFEEICDP